MIVSAIVAVSENGGIGFEGGIPWRLRTDMKLFKETTMGHHLVMGRKTWESIGRPLPGRQMVVITRQKNYLAEGCDVVHSVEAAVALAAARGETEMFIGGGAEIYHLAWPLLDQIYLTQVQAQMTADTYLPKWNLDAWRMIEQRAYEVGENDEYPFTWTLFTRN